MVYPLFVYGSTDEASLGEGSHGARPTVYTFLPAVMGMGGVGMQQQLQQSSGGMAHQSGDGSASPFSVAGSGGGLSGSGPQGISRPSPVMNAGE